MASGIGGLDPYQRPLMHTSSPQVDLSEVRPAYEGAIDRPKEHHSEVGFLLPNGSVESARLGKNEEYGAHRVGSVTKTFTALLAMKLVKDGVLPNGLNTRCGDLLPDDILREVFEDLEAARNMTLEQLLSHTSGLESDDHCRLQDPNTRPTTLHERFLMEGRVGHKYKHTSQPGDRVGSYSNAGLAVAGWMLERAYEQRYGRSIPFSQIMKTELFEGVFGLSESFIAPGPSGDIIQSPAGDMTSSINDLLKVAARLQEGEASLEYAFGAGWQSNMLRPRDLLEHHGLGCGANATSIQHAGMNREKFGDEERDVTALVVFPLRGKEAGLVAMCDSSALGPNPQEQRFINALKTSVGIPGDEQSVYDLVFYCPASENAFVFHGNAYLITDVDPFAKHPPDKITCSCNGMRHELFRDPSIDKKGICGYRDKKGGSWLVITKEDGYKAIYSDYCLVTKAVDMGVLAAVQPSLATVQSLQGVYQNEENSDKHPTYTFTEQNGRLYLRDGNDKDSFPCLYIPDDAGGAWVVGNPKGRPIKIRFPDNPDANYLEITDIYTGLPQPPDKSRRRKKIG
jgi:hypothetical protein